MSQSVLAIGDFSVRQHDGLFSLNDLHTASGGEEKHEPNYFVRLDQTQALISEISKSPEMGNLEPIKTARGRNGGTYACRELVIAYAAWISAAFHLKVIRVFLNATAPAIPDRISHAQAQHLRELVQMVVESGKQGYGETWNRLQRKFKVNKYELLAPSQFDAACEYLRGKLDAESMAALVQKHFPDAVKAIAAPDAPPMDMERIRQTMAAANEVAAKVQAAVFFAMLTGDKNWQNERWGLSFLADGRNDSAPPTPKAFPLSLLRMAKEIEQDGALYASVAEMLALASACTKSSSLRLAA